MNEAAELSGPGGLLDIELAGPQVSDHIAVPNAGFQMRPGGPGTSEPPPRVDEHRDEILDWLEREEKPASTTA